jgi:hypothetical protein
MLQHGNGQTLILEDVTVDADYEIPYKHGGAININEDEADVDVTWDDDAEPEDFSVWAFSAQAIYGDGSGHTVTLPTGWTWDGSNDKATFDAAGETLLCIALPGSLMKVLANPDSVAFS